MAASKHAIGAASSVKILARAGRNCRGGHLRANRAWINCETNDFFVVCDDEYRQWVCDVSIAMAKEQVACILDEVVH